jgi:hypothetical protein
LPSTQTREIHTRGRVRNDSSDVCYCWLHCSISWRRLGVPFIDPKGLGAVGNHLEGNTCFLSGGAPDSPVHHRTGPVACPVHDLLPIRAQLTVGATVVLAHRTLSGAHRTVRCANYPLAQATRRPLITLLTVGTVDRWLTGQSGEL